MVISWLIAMYEMLLILVLSMNLVLLLIDSSNYWRYIKQNIYTAKFMSIQNSQNHKRQEQNNTEWLDELINKIENMKNKISSSF